MRRSSLPQGFDLAVAYPLRHDRPEESWEAAQASGSIPEGLFRFYCRTRFLSSGAAPTFLSDQTGLLFAYLRVITNGVRKCLEEAHESLGALRDAHEEECRTTRASDRPTWDHAAIQRQQRAFREVLFALAAGLDQSAEILALLFFGTAKGLALGSAGVVELRASLRKAAADSSPTLHPKVLEWHALSRALLPVLEGSGSSRGWLDQFLLFRNKLVHYGPSGFMLSLGLYDASRNVFTFLPRDWPQLPEQFITPAGSPSPPPEEPSSFERACLEEDLVEYSVGLHATVRAVIELIFGSLSLSYDVLTGMPTPRGLEQAFFKARVTTSFQHF